MSLISTLIAFCSAGELRRLGDRSVRVPNEIEEQFLGAASASENSDSGSPVCDGWKVYADAKSANGSQFPAGYFCRSLKDKKFYICASGPGASVNQVYMDFPCSSSMKIISDSKRSLYHKDDTSSDDSSDSDDVPDQEPECSKWEIYSNNQLDFGVAISENLSGYFCSNQNTTYKCASYASGGLRIRNPCPASAKLPSASESKTQAPPATGAATTVAPVTNESSTTAASGDSCSSWSKVSTGQTLQIGGSDTAGLFCNNSSGVWKCNDSGVQGVQFKNCPDNMKTKDDQTTLII